MKIKVNIIVCTIIISFTNSCVIDENRRAKKLATKTPYEYVLDSIRSSKKSIELPDEDCKPSKFWLISRHGTRYPSKKGVEAIIDIMPEILNNIDLRETKLCEKDFELLKSWKPDVTVSDTKKLHPEGEKELTLMAERFADKFPNLLKQNYDPNKFHFRATATQRAERSAFFFATGLFDRKVAYEVKYDEPITPHDPLIRFYKLCEKWKQDVKHNPQSLLEQKLFEQSQQFQQELTQPLSKLLTQNLTLDQIDAIWVACTFGQAWEPLKLSPWCGIFTQNQLDLMAFRQDLEYFYIDSYAHKINYEQACVLLKDVIEKFDDEASQDNTLYFSHSGAILKFLAYLGIDKPNEFLKHDSDIRKKHWNTSARDSFASNVAFVYLKPCQKIGMLINEELTEIPACDNQLWCPYEKFKEIFQSYNSSGCNFSKICNLNNLEEVQYINTEEETF